MKIEIQKLTDTAKIPTRGSEYAAGYDLYVDTRSTPGLNDYRDDFRKNQGIIFIPPHTNAKLSTGISVAIPKGYFGAIFARSGLASKQGLRPANCVGVIDADYRGPVMVALHNDSNITAQVNDGERIAQLVILPCQDIEFEEVDTLDTTDRGSGGFGSTGKI